MTRAPYERSPITGMLTRAAKEQIRREIERAVKPPVTYLPARYAEGAEPPDGHELRRMFEIGC